jgi:hypothetical protein
MISNRSRPHARYNVHSLGSCIESDGFQYIMIFPIKKQWFEKSLVYKTSTNKYVHKAKVVP